MRRFASIGCFSRSQPSMTTPPPTPVPSMAPNTPAEPAAAPSVASESAKQSASLAISIGSSNSLSRSCFIGLPFMTTVLQFFMVRSVGSCAPGVPIPIPIGVVCAKSHILSTSLLIWWRMCSYPWSACVGTLSLNKTSGSPADLRITPSIFVPPRSIPHRLLLVISCTI